RADHLREADLSEEPVFEKNPAKTRRLQEGRDRQAGGIDAEARHLEKAVGLTFVLARSTHREDELAPEMARNPFAPPRAVRASIPEHPARDARIPLIPAVPGKRLLVPQLVRRR